MQRVLEAGYRGPEGDSAKTRDRLPKAGPLSDRQARRLVSLPKFV